MTTNGPTLDPNAERGNADPRAPTFCRLAFTAAGLLIVLFYAVQIHSPLRVNPDAVNLLDLASRLTDHRPFLIDGVRSPFPIGTPLLFSTMERLRVADSSGFIFVNVVCLVIAALASASICRALRITSPWLAWVLIFAFSSFVLVKHVGIPLSDFHYMAASLGAVAMLESAQRSVKKEKWFRFAIAVMLVAAAILLRRIGIALIPACLFIWRPSWRQMGDLRRNVAASKRAGVAFLAAFVAVAASVVLLRSYLLYLPDFRPEIAGRRPTQLIGRLLYIRFLDLGEVLLNVPYAKLQRLHGFVPVAGISMIAILVAGIWRARRHLHAAHAYILSYLAIMFVWPFGDNRFWLPVLPLLAAVSFQGIEPLLARPSVRWILASYATLYLMMFTIAAVYTTRITFSRNFPEAYADGRSSAITFRPGQTAR